MGLTLYRRVELTERRNGLEAGTTGYIIDFYDGDQDAEVEFMDVEGDTIAVETIPSSKLRAVGKIDDSEIQARPS